VSVIVKKTDLQRTLDGAKQNHEFAKTFTDPKSAARIYKMTADSCVGALLGTKPEQWSDINRALVLQAIVSYTAAAGKYVEAGRNNRANKIVEKGLCVLGAYGFNPVNQRELDQVNLLLDTAKSVKTKALEILNEDLSKALRAEHEQ
jgi:hypothetical protein